MDLTSYSDRQLLRMYATVMRELRDRGSISSSNNPVADVAENLAAGVFGLTLAPNSEKGFDGTDTDGKRYQVKGRRLTPENKSMELSLVRDIADRQFDYFVAIYFDEFWDIHEAARLTYAAFVRHASYSGYRNGHRFSMTRAVRQDAEYENVTLRVASAWV